MSQDLLTLFNAACEYAGVRESLDSPDETTTLASRLRRQYPLARRRVFAAGNFQCSKKFARLALAAEREEGSLWTASMPDPRYRFAYSIPNEMVHPRYLESGAHFDLSLLSEDVKVLCTNEEQALLCYSFDQENIAIWEPLLFDAVCAVLGASIALPTTGKINYRQNALAAAQGMVDQANATSGNAKLEEIDFVAPWHQARQPLMIEAEGLTRFTFPLETLNLGQGKG